MLVSRGFASLDFNAMLGLDCLVRAYNYHTGMRLKFICFGLINLALCVPTLYLRHYRELSNRLKGQYSRAVYLWIGINYLIYATMCYTVFRAM